VSPLDIWIGLSAFVAVSLAFAYWLTRPWRNRDLGHLQGTPLAYYDAGRRPGFGRRPNKSRLPGPAVKCFDLEFERDNAATVRLGEITTVKMPGSQKRAMRRRSRRA
jgi:hypothetical protein